MTFTKCNKNVRNALVLDTPFSTLLPTLFRPRCAALHQATPEWKRWIWGRPCDVRTLGSDSKIKDSRGRKRKIIDNVMKCLPANLHTKGPTYWSTLFIALPAKRIFDLAGSDVAKVVATTQLKQLVPSSAFVNSKVHRQWFNATVEAGTIKAFNTVGSRLC